MQTPNYARVLRDIHSLPPVKTGCRHDLLPNGVQELTLGVASQYAITEWVRSLDTVVRQASSGRPLRVLTDARRSLLPPLAYISHIADLMMLHPHSVPGGRTLSPALWLHWRKTSPIRCSTAARRFAFSRPTGTSRRSAGSRTNADNQTRRT